MRTFLLAITWGITVTLFFGGMIYLFGQERLLYECKTNKYETKSYWDFYREYDKQINKDYFKDVLLFSNGGFQIQEIYKPDNKPLLLHKSENGTVSRGERYWTFQDSKTNIILDRFDNSFVLLDEFDRRGKKMGMTEYVWSGLCNDTRFNGFFRERIIGFRDIFSF